MKEKEIITKIGIYMPGGYTHNIALGPIKRLGSFVLSRVESASRMIQWTLDSDEILLYHIEGTSNLTY